MCDEYDELHRAKEKEERLMREVTAGTAEMAILAFMLCRKRGLDEEAATAEALFQVVNDEWDPEKAA